MELTRWLNVLQSQKVLDNHYIKKEVSVVKKHKTEKPIILLFSADWHLGSPHVDHEALFEDIENFTSYDPQQVRLILGGDLIDNFSKSFPSAEAAMNYYIRPELQRELLLEIVDEIGDYIDLSTWGNHDVQFDEKNIGFSDVARILRKRATFFHGKGFVVYYVGNQKYTLLISHHLKGSSIYHDLQGPMRAWNECRADIVVGAHHHSPSFMVDFRGFDENGIKQRLLMKLGSYKSGHDTFSERYFKSGVFGNNVVVLFPNEKKMLPFLDFNDAVDFLGLEKKPKKVKPKTNKKETKK